MRGHTWLLVLLCLLTSSCLSRYGGNFAGPPAEIHRISEKSKGLIQKAVEDFPNDGVIYDYHLHVAALNQIGSRTQHADLEPLCPQAKYQALHQSKVRLHPSRFSIFPSFASIKTSFMFHAATGNENKKDATYRYMSRLIEQVKTFQETTLRKGKFHLLAMDGFYKTDGSFSEEKTDLYIPNEFLVDLVRCLNSKFKDHDPFVPVISVHPYRKDAIETLRYYRKHHAVRFVKWLPNAQNIDPLRPEIGEYYQTMAELGMTLISHTGHESTLITDDKHQKWGNPQRLKPALDRGVKVIMAHCGRDRSNPDLHTGKMTANFDHFIKMMDNPEYHGFLFGDLTALTIANTIGHLDRIASKPEIHSRIVNGSDYPLPAVFFLVESSLNALVKNGFLDRDEVDPLKEIYSYNPLL